MISKTFNMHGLQQKYMMSTQGGQGIAAYGWIMNAGVFSIEPTLGDANQRVFLAAADSSIGVVS